MNETQARAEILEAIGRWSAALGRKDLDALASEVGDHIELFDVGSQRSGRDEYLQIWADCFPFFGDTIGVERREMKIHVSGELAVAHCFTPLTGMQGEGDLTRSWMRATICYRKSGGHWQSVHEHVSLPVDCVAERPLYLLDGDGDGSES